MCKSLGCSSFKKLPLGPLALAGKQGKSYSFLGLVKEGMEVSLYSETEASP